MLLKCRPEDKAGKKERLLKRAQPETEGKTVEAKKPIVLTYGLKHITYLIEQIYVWSMKRGRLLNVLSDHEGPVHGLTFPPTNAVLTIIIREHCLLIRCFLWVRCS